MAGLKTIFSCTNCGAQFPKWSGRCLECGSWGTLSAEVSDLKKEKQSILEKNIGGADIISLADIKDDPLLRFKSNFLEFDRVLGGGLVPGSLVLLSGEPGIGKSTLVAQIAAATAISGTIYASGEESAVQVKGRLERLKLDLEKFRFISETNVEKIISSVLKADVDQR